MIHRRHPQQYVPHNLIMRLLAYVLGTMHRLGREVIGVVLRAA